MKASKRFLVLIALVFLGTYGGLDCGGSGNNPPNQFFVDQVLGQLTTDAGTIFGDFISATTCAEVDTTANQFNNTAQNCTPNLQGVAGTFTDSINPNPPTCSDGPPLTISATITQVLNNCVSSSIATIYTGTVSNQLSTFEDTGTVIISSDDLVVSGIPFTVSDLKLTFTNLTTCSGTMTANGFACTVSSDCTTCTF